MTAGNTVVARDLVVDHPTPTGMIRALSHARLDVPGGSSVAIMGPSGCGKSTLLGLLAGLAVPTEGTVTIGDTTISRLPERERVRFRRRSIGMVYQADNLLPHLTVEENVALPIAISRSGHDVDRPSEEPGDLLKRLGLGDFSHRFPDQLSGGQRQRVAVARAIVNRPLLVLADEPTGSLDDDSARAVIELLVEVQLSISATLVLVTHDPEIASHTDRVELLTPSRRPG